MAERVEDDAGLRHGTEPLAPVDTRAAASTEPPPPIAPAAGLESAPVSAEAEHRAMDPTLEPGADQPPVDLGRLAWLMTVATLLVGIVVLTLKRDYGYAGVTLAVAVSAAINLL